VNADTLGGREGRDEVRTVSTAESSSIGTAVVAIAFGAGFLWARASSRLPIPEVLKMLRAPVVSAVVSLVPVARWFLLNVRADRHVVTIQTVIKGTLVMFIAAIPVVAFPGSGLGIWVNIPGKDKDHEGDAVVCRFDGSSRGVRGTPGSSHVRLSKRHTRR
jgi:hypothetical protein